MVGPDRGRQDRGRGAPRRADRDRGGQRRLAPGLPRHGHRHRQADAGGARGGGPSPPRRGRAGRALPRRALPAATRAAAIADIRARGRLPVVVGGTGLYVRALLKGLTRRRPPIPRCARSWRRSPRAHGAPRCTRGWPRSAPDAARRLHPNDRVRVVRAIEIHTRARGRAAGGARTATGAAPRARGASYDRAPTRARPRSTRRLARAGARDARPWHDGRGAAPARRGPRPGAAADGRHRLPAVRRGRAGRPAAWPRRCGS